LVFTTQKETSTLTRVLSMPVKVHVVDPSAYTPAYDHALCAALALAGVDVELFTSRFAYGEAPPPAGYSRRELFYRAARGAPASPLRRALKLAGHVPGMLRYRAAAQAAELVHFQWLALPQIDGWLLPRGRPLVLTAHDVLAREPTPAQRSAQLRLYRRMDAVIVHSEHGRARLIGELGLAPERVHTIPHGAFEHLARLPETPLPGELAAGPQATRAPVVLCFGVIRPYKGVDVLIEAWQDGLAGAELWIVGRPRGVDLRALARRAPASVRWVTRYVSDGELAACFRRADVVVAPYREIEQSGVLATALAFASPLVLSDVGGFNEVAAAGAAQLVPPGDPAALREALVALLGDGGERERLSVAARALAEAEWSWQRVAERTKALYSSLLS
jgi:glycosyltransferase involved in cell wall biosynthesis